MPELQEEQRGECRRGEAFRTAIQGGGVAHCFQFGCSCFKERSARQILLVRVGLNGLVFQAGKQSEKSDYCSPRAQMFYSFTNVVELHGD